MPMHTYMPVCVRLCFTVKSKVCAAYISMQYKREEDGQMLQVYDNRMLDDVM